MNKHTIEEQHLWMLSLMGDTLDYLSQYENLMTPEELSIVSIWRRNYKNGIYTDMDMVKVFQVLRAMSNVIARIKLFRTYF